MSAHNYCWSSDEGVFHRDYATREEALAQAKAILADLHESGDKFTVLTGEVREAVHFLRQWEHDIGDSVVDHVDAWLLDHITSEEPIIDLDKDGKTELGRLVVDFLEARASFGRYCIDEIRTHEVTVPPQENA